MTTMSSVDTTLPIKDLLNANPVWIRNSEDMGDLDALAQHMRLHGQCGPVICDPTFRVIDGARRIEAALRLGWKDINVVCTSDFGVITHFMEVAREREKVHQDVTLPHKWLETAQLVWVLRDIYKHVSVQTMLKTKRSGQRRRANATYQFSGATVDIPEALGISKIQARLLGRAWTLLHEDEWTADQRKAMLLGLQRAEAANHPHAVLTSMRKMIERPLQVPSVKEVLKAQKTAIPNAILAISGAVLAFPQIDEIDPGHNLEDMRRWDEGITPLIQQLSRFRKELRKLANNQGDQNDTE